MTDNEIIKALEWHLNSVNNCDECPYKAIKNTIVIISRKMI